MGKRRGADIEKIPGNKEVQESLAGMILRISTVLQEALMNVLNVNPNMQYIGYGLALTILERNNRHE